MTAVWIAGAMRSAVTPRNGDLKSLEVHELAGPLIRTLVERSAADVDLRCEVILGNALYGGGNPARLASLTAGLSESVPAFTIDTQCCSGLDAISFGASRIAGGAVDIVFAGGAESYSRSPLRFRRPVSPQEEPVEYFRPPFTPWADRDPDLIESAATLATARQISREAQEAFAIESHRKALRNEYRTGEILQLGSVERDTFARNLTASTCGRLPILAGEPKFALAASTVAVEADGAAVVLLASDSALKALKTPLQPLRYIGAISRGFDPAMPALAPCEAAWTLLDRLKLRSCDLAAVEIMEAFAVQSMAFIDDLELDLLSINRGGGALARGHPIGASGAILAVRLFHEMQRETSGSKGLTAIAAAGGLGSAMVWER